MKPNKFIIVLNYILNYVGIVALVSIPVYFGYIKQPTEMGISIGAIGLALLFLNLDKFSEFKGGGIEAKMREAVQEAHATIEDMRKLAVAISRPVILQTTITGRTYRFINNSSKLDLLSKISQALKEIEVSKENINELYSESYLVFTEDMVEILYEANIDKPQLFDKARMRKWQAEQIEVFMKDNNLTTTEELAECVRLLKEIQKS